ncbi:unnamed protein product [Polarella glacialis]|uniref:RNA helicase n=1 Tax=Polarella glacialis TaxID=89957 RepID=A0A813LX05_POLGL|nr:unnamed protein product [Polarella glacialis]
MHLRSSSAPAEAAPSAAAAVPAKAEAGWPSGSGWSGGSGWASGSGNNSSNNNNNNSNNSNNNSSNNNNNSNNSNNSNWSWSAGSGWPSGSWWSEGYGGATGSRSQPISGPVPLVSQPISGSGPPPEPASEPVPKVAATPGVEAKVAATPGVEVRGCGDLPVPWSSWHQVDFHERLKSQLLAAGFPSPSSIQQHAWPLVRGGHDLIGIARTGSGKTLAFLMPAFSNILESAERTDLPEILVLAPTRELACQIETEAQKFGSPAGMRTVTLYGGAPKGPQLGSLRRRPQLVVATPGRLNDFLEPGTPGMAPGVDLGSVRFLVLDEADRMLDMGFEPQIRKIIAKVPRKRQTMMFTATWPEDIRSLAADFLTDPVEVRVGNCDELEANPDIEQRVLFCSDLRDKHQQLEKLVKEFQGKPVIVFVNTKRLCDSLACDIFDSVTIHGDRTQEERDTALLAFRKGVSSVLVATDVAARGLDIKGVKLVVNFDNPPREEDYVHRIGRTGRAGQSGLAVSLLTDDDGGAARNIMEVMKRSGKEVPTALEERLESGKMRFPVDRGPRDKDREKARRRSHSLPAARPPRGSSFRDLGSDCPTSF